MPSHPEGLNKVFVGTNPAANTEISETVPAGKWWLVRAISASLAQGLTQTPQPILTIGDGTNTLFEEMGSSAAQAASTTCRYNWAPATPLSGQVGATTNVHSTAPLPDRLVVGPGYTFATTTIGIGANTDYAAPVIFVTEYNDFPAHLF